MKTGLKLSAVLLTLAIPVTLIACGATAANNGASNSAKNSTVNTTTTPTATPTPDQAAAPQELYKKNCAECHKDTGKGGEAVVDGKKIDAKDLTGDRMVKRSDAKLFDDIAEGSPDDGMPAFREKLTDAQINDIVKYVRELQKGK